VRPIVVSFEIKTIPDNIIKNSFIRLTGTVLAATAFIVEGAVNSPPANSNAGVKVKANNLVETQKTRDSNLKDWDEQRENHWAWRELTDPKPPPVAGENWVRNPIDRFILSKLEERGLSLNPEADGRTLSRRLHFDLIGLPDVWDFKPKTFEVIMDELLHSPHFGERWARHWLDVARFAESHGFEQDYDRPHAYHYRDFVIKAFNQDMPFDQFVRWQVAGDEIAPGEPLALMATGFLGAGVFPTQLTEKEFETARYDELDDMVNTTGLSFLALTIGCARCHEHRYDPIETEDYYRLVSTFGHTIRSEIDVALDSTKHEKALENWERERATLVVARDKFEQEELPGRFAEWLLNPPGSLPASSPWSMLDNVESKSLDGATIMSLKDGSLLLSGKNPKDDRWVVTAKVNLPKVTALRIEALTHKSMKRNGPGRANNGNFALSDIRVFAKSAGETGRGEPVKLITPRADHQQNSGNLSIASSIDGDKRKTGWAVDGQIGKDHVCVFQFAEPVEHENGCVLTLELDYFVNTSHVIGRPRFSVSSESAPPLKGKGQSQVLAGLLTAVNRPGGIETLDEKQRASLLEAYRAIDKKWMELNTKVTTHEAIKPQPKTVKVMVSSEGQKPIKHHADGRGYPHFYKETYVLSRGNPNRKGKVATQAFLPLLMRNGKDSMHWQVEPREGARSTHRRQALANWLTDVENGAGYVAARVIVNRLWQHHFGHGLVATPNDFGTQSEPPTHPELLDWLASRLLENGWRLKPIHRLILSSATWRQSSGYVSAKAAKDLGNQLLWRFTPRRLEGEVIRDSLLAVSGQLDKTMFGRGTLDERSRRRSVYFMIKRSKLIPTMQLFDAPEPLVSQGHRASTTIAPQALMFMNSPHIRQYALSLAQRLAREGGDDAEKIVASGYLAALGRQPDPDERSATLAFLRKQETSYREAEQRNPRHLALVDFAQTLFALNEFSYLR